MLRREKDTRHLPHPNRTELNRKSALPWSLLAQACFCTCVNSYCIVLYIQTFVYTRVSVCTGFETQTTGFQLRREVWTISWFFGNRAGETKQEQGVKAACSYGQLVRNHVGNVCRLQTLLLSPPGRPNAVADVRHTCRKVLVAAARLYNSKQIRGRLKKRHSDDGTIPATE